jgi:hypothetical protein
MTRKNSRTLRGAAKPKYLTLNNSGPKLLEGKLPREVLLTIIRRIEDWQENKR